MRDPAARWRAGAFGMTASTEETRGMREKLTTIPFGRSVYSPTDATTDQTSQADKTGSQQR